MNSTFTKVTQSVSIFKSSTSMNKFFQLSALLIAFAGITGTASADNSRKLDLSKITVIDNGPMLEEQLPSTPSKSFVEPEASAPQYLWNKSSRTWVKNPSYSKAKVQSRK